METHREDGRGKTKAEIGVMLKEHLLEAGRGKEESSSLDSRGSMTLSTP